MKNMTQREKSDNIKTCIDLLVEANDGKPLEFGYQVYCKLWKHLEKIVGHIDAIKLIYYYNTKTKKYTKYKKEEIYS